MNTLYCNPFAVPGLPAGDRTEVQSDWMQGKVLVIVATISFGMGVDKANVRWDKTIMTFLAVFFDCER